MMSSGLKWKSTSHVGPLSNICECYHYKRYCWVISSWGIEKGHWMLVNDQTLANVFIFREIVQRSYLDYERKGIGCWSMIKHWRMCSSSEILFNNLISMKRKRTSDVGQWSSIGECVHLCRICSIIWFRWRERGHGMLVNDQTLANVFIIG